MAWPPSPRRIAERVVARRRDRNRGGLVECDLCDAPGPWPASAVDPLTAWVVCPRCWVELGRFRRELDAYGRTPVRS
jgi:hypothetical protein